LAAILANDWEGGGGGTCTPATIDLVQYKKNMIHKKTPGLGISKLYYLLGSLSISLTSGRSLKSFD
jgi:hypothetical protein